MKHRHCVTALAVLALATPLSARQTAPAPAPPTADAPFTYQKVMIAMRDGVRLETVIMTPRGATKPLPILFQRTPYGMPGAAPRTVPAGWAALAADGYILVFQSMRGRFGSEGGPFTLSTELRDNGTDEASDAYDSIDWLIGNLPGNNGRVGMWGVSYPGLAAGIALARPHPALKAVSPQAPWTDYFMNDDLHRNGAMRLSYAYDWLYLLQAEKTNAETRYDAYDMYDWFLKAGSPDEIERTHLKGRVPLFRAMIENPDYNQFWRRQVWTARLGRTTVPTLNVAGLWDQEDPWGPWEIHRKQQQADPQNLSVIVAGPWNHGGWRGKGDALGRIPIGTDSGTQFQTQIEAPFFRHWLHGGAGKPAFEAAIFQSGSWAWKRYSTWPLKGTTARKLYLNPDGSLGFTQPTGSACRDYVSDPANPVPYRQRPISPTWGSPDWPNWESEDQRFLQGRPDVLTYTSAPLDADLTVTGRVAATLMASTSGTDSDFVVKLIDVFPHDYEKPSASAKPGDYARSLNGYQLPIAMEVRRGRLLDGFEASKPLVPDQVRAWDLPLHDRDHVFKRGHRIMVQVQSSWFPVIDRNPQKFVTNPYKAQPGDYVKATQRVCAGSFVSLPVAG
ncbi:X-Pro dipeptidyl-peptidase [Sphingomonas turrisvirgatae]|uniref:X-Pro dipeptidyl-peptidase n=2 Tax=Sphingomonas turrisvirgatae TaxID=1888892 RepID=A0A1E3M188_9SPHN|nr:X-Pro dipeptidyl-peptidase [Sphingomonas turrisvirgatae]